MYGTVANINVIVPASLTFSELNRIFKYWFTDDSFKS